MDKAQYGHKPIRNEKTGETRKTSPSVNTLVQGQNYSLSNTLSLFVEAMLKHCGETGLNNLKPVEQQIYAALNMGFKLLDEAPPFPPVELCKFITALVETVYGHYVPDKKYAVKYVSVMIDETKCLTAPLDLTSHILMQGKDIPPTDLPEYGEWAGIETLYLCTNTLTKSYEGSRDILIPTSKITPILTT